MFTLYNYIPYHLMYLNIYGIDIQIDGIYEFKIQIDKAVANYSVWIDTVHIKPLLPTDKQECVICDPFEVEEKGTLKIRELEIDCSIKRVSYISRRHGYIVEIVCSLDPKHLTKFKYISTEEKKKEFNKFEMLDI